MASAKPVLHGADHRPVGFYGPSDRGGVDPIPSRPDDDVVRYIRTKVNYSAMTSPIDVVDWSAGDGAPSVETNDNETATFTAGTALVTPIVTDHFTVDYDTAPTVAIEITGEGVYLVRGAAFINSFSPFDSPQFWMIAEVNAPNLGVANNGSKYIDGAADIGSWATESGGVVVVDSPPYSLSLNVMQNSGDTVATDQGGVSVEVYRLSGLTVGA